MAWYWIEMPSVGDIERRLARAEQLQNPVSTVCGVGLAVAYLAWQYFVNHWIATYTWMVPFGIGYVAPRLWFASYTTKLESARKELVSGPIAELPEARAHIVASPSGIAPVAPKPVVHTPDADGPALLK